MALGFLVPIENWSSLKFPTILTFALVLLLNFEFLFFLENKYGQPFYDAL